jgi:hypothetical protein
MPEMTGHEIPQEEQYVSRSRFQPRTFWIQAGSVKAIFICTILKYNQYKLKRKLSNVQT